MTLADLTDRHAVLQALAEYDDLGRDTFLANYGFGKARSYYAQHSRRLYDSKAVVGAAHGCQIGQPLTAADFSGRGGHPRRGRPVGWGAYAALGRERRVICAKPHHNKR